MNKLTIYFTSDIHGYLYPTDFAHREPQRQGLLSMRFPKDGNTLVIDGGDCIQGSPLIYYCRLNGITQPMADAMNRMGYDYFTLGNHDFNNGYDYLRSHIERMNAKCLCANVESDLPILPACVHTLENGLRIGIVGIVTDWVNLWEKPENLEKIHVTEPLAAAKAAIRDLEADIIIGIYHGGIEKDLSTGRVLSETTENIACRLCEELPLDLLLTGHQHIAMANREWHGTHIVQTPANATEYIRVVMDREGRFTSELLHADSPACLTEAECKLQDDMDVWLDTPIGHLDRPLWPEDKTAMAMHGSGIADLVNMVQLWVSGADISCTALGNSVRGFDTNVTVRDVVASYIYSNTLKVLDITGDILREALEQCASYFHIAPDGTVEVSEHFLVPKEAHYNYDYFMGIDYAFDITRPVGSRVVRMKRNGQPISADEHLSLVMCNYRATGAGDFECYLRGTVIREYPDEVSEQIIDYLVKHKEVVVPEYGPIVI